ncbi:histidine phosphatase family protein [Salinibacterium sp. NG253]|uniref:histidine phosphatase family protein n=1 Tax=Salinibacterium sp. NG253 TaxID=2792039 RepID=UPI0018CDCEBC|nr:histidine phosphatase family protein [Salinibacterium sp. NG253]MBH0115958.1 histidine phosphatase family protein [Salinibacterium sp. NG253]
MLSLIRHGQTDWNAAGRMQGSSDIPLNDTGREQAREAVEVLRGSEWDVIVSSPLQRARETAQIIADGLGLELGRSYDLLIERNYGEGEGLTKAEIDERWPNNPVYPGLESLHSVVERGIAALHEVSADYPGKKVIVVCHGTIIRYTLSELAGRDFDQIVNGSVSTIEKLHTGWCVHTVNGAPLSRID